MHNVTHEVKGGKLIITVDIAPKTCETAKFSSTGKTRLIGTTGGAMPIAAPQGWSVTFALNVMGKQQ
jgi:hypothetical protein